jgi:hypothetical protein
MDDDGRRATEHDARRRIAARRARSRERTGELEAAAAD